MATPKKVILIWDLDGAIGQINATLPYNFHFSQLSRELDNVRYALDVMERHGVKSTFAITGFSAEEGIYPYTFPELIHEISQRGHEVASHSWRHEWLPLFSIEQARKSLSRSKLALEKVNSKIKVNGFVPPHNRPMSWISRGAYSLGDRGLYPFFSMGDMGSLLKILREANYKWIRVSYRSVFHKLGLTKTELTGRAFTYQGMLILENHYTGFDPRVVGHILQSNQPTYTLSAHPLMLDFPGKHEHKENFESFLKQLTESGIVQFVTPSQLAV